MESIPLPSSITKIEEHDHRAVFSIEPLYPGYGVTVGNALRRVLLSSMPGAAITNVKIEGVTHEFSSLPFVKEDIVDIMLNLKRVRLRLHRDEPTVVTLEVKGAKLVTAGDITTTDAVDILNPDQPIATITDKAGTVSMELTVAPGRGYVPVENREKERLDIGTTALDAIYTPVRNVNFTTEHVRVEQMTNYDKLLLDITTDGTMTPDSALREAAQIMVDHFQFILGGVPAAAGEAAPEDDKPKKKAAKKKVKEDKEE